MAKRRKARTRAAKKKPVRRSRRIKKLGPECNGAFCSDPNCKHAKKHENAKKANPDSKKRPALKGIQKPAISKKKKPVKRLKKDKPVKIQKKRKNAKGRKKKIHAYNRFVSHVFKRCRDAGVKQPRPTLMKQAAHCWKAISPEQKALFETDSAKDLPTSTSAPEDPSQVPASSPPPAAPAPQAPPSNPNVGTRYFPRPPNGPPYFLNGNMPFYF